MTAHGRGVQRLASISQREECILDHTMSICQQRSNSLRTIDISTISATRSSQNKRNTHSIEHELLHHSAFAASIQSCAFGERRVILHSKGSGCLDEIGMSTRRCFNCQEMSPGEPIAECIRGRRIFQGGYIKHSQNRRQREEHHCVRQIDAGTHPVHHMNKLNLC